MDIFIYLYKNFKYMLKFNKKYIFILSIIFFSCQESLTTSSIDCNGTANGASTLDSCGVCLNPTDLEWNASCEDCSGKINGDGYLDDCGYCICGTLNGNIIAGNIPCFHPVDSNGDGIANQLDGEYFTVNTVNDGETGNWDELYSTTIPCIHDCQGILGGSAYLDECGFCAGYYDEINGIEFFFHPRVDADQDGFCDGVDADGDGFCDPIDEDGNCNDDPNPNDPLYPTDNCLCDSELYESSEDCPGNSGIIDDCDICNGPGKTTYYADIDDDGFGDLNNTVSICPDEELSNENPWVLDNTDIDDNCFSNILDCNNICDGDSIEDTCGICGGPGEIYDCGCSDIPDGLCDCDGNVLDLCEVCGGDGTSCLIEEDGWANLPNNSLYLYNNSSIYYNSTETINEFAIAIDGISEITIINANGFSINESGNLLLATGGNIPPGSGELISFNLGDEIATGISGIIINDDSVSFENCDLCYSTSSIGACDMPTNTISLHNNTEVWYNVNQDIGGFQWTIDGTTANGASGGDAASNGFDVTAAGTTVLGFHFTAGYIQAGCGLLTILDLNDDATGFSNIVFSNPGAVGFDVTYFDLDDGETDGGDDGGGTDDGGDDGGGADDGGDDGGGLNSGCDLPNNTIYLNNNSEVWYNVDTDIGGFQWVINDEITASSASGGDAEAAGFTVSVGGSTVLGFSFTGSSVTAGCGILTNLSLDGIADGFNTIVFSTAGNDPEDIGVSYYTGP